MCSMSGTAVVTTGNPERKNIVIKLRKPLKSAERSLAFIHWEVYPGMESERCNLVLFCSTITA